MLVKDLIRFGRNLEILVSRMLAILSTQYRLCDGPYLDIISRPILSNLYIKSLMEYRTIKYLIFVLI